MRWKQIKRNWTEHKLLCPLQFYMLLKVESDGMKHGPYCGSLPDINALPSPIVTSGNRLRVIFHSDTTINQQGFRASYHLTGKGQLNHRLPFYSMLFWIWCILWLNLVKFWALLGITIRAGSVYKGKGWALDIAETNPYRPIFVILTK